MEKGEYIVRVIAGKARRVALKTIEGFDTRPTTDRIKETLFNMIQPYIYGVRFLDLFSGSGAIGIEALSRGADLAVFVENNRNAVNCIKENLKSTKLISEAKIMESDVIAALQALEDTECFDYIFMDPPYNQGFEEQVFEYLSDSSLVTEETVIILETSLHTELEYLEEWGYQIVKTKEYKTNKHVFIELEKGERVC